MVRSMAVRSAAPEKGWQRFATKCRRLFNHKWLYLMLLPCLANFVIFHYWPMYGLQIAFKRFNIVLGAGASPWIGLEHFVNFFSSYYFWEVMGNTLRISLLSIVIGFEMCDYIFSEEGRNLFTWGVEGVTYNVVDGKKQYVNEIMEDPAGPLDGRRKMGVQPVSFLHVSEWEGWEAALPEYVMKIAQETADSVSLPILPGISATPEEETELANIMTDITKYVDSQLPLFVNGTLNTEEDFDAFIAQLEDMGILEAKEIRDAQFERWQNR